MWLFAYLKNLIRRVVLLLFSSRVIFKLFSSFLASFRSGTIFPDSRRLITETFSYICSPRSSLDQPFFFPSIPDDLMIVFNNFVGWLLRSECSSSAPETRLAGPRWSFGGSRCIVPNLEHSLHVDMMNFQFLFLLVFQ